MTYDATSRFPREEMNGLTSQMRRAAVSVPSNIAEGCGRKSTAEYIRSLHVAYGSLCELETQPLLAHDLGYIDDTKSADLMDTGDDVERLLDGLIKALKAKQNAEKAIGHQTTPPPSTRPLDH